jgi:uncharacterized protein YndB with AHSA1/START domain
MLKRLLLSLAVVFALVVSALLAIAASRPDTFRVERSLHIAAPPAQLFALINDLRAWRGWSPYETKDPGMQRRFSGPPAGVGAHCAWQGNDEVGAGSMTITASDAPRRLVIQLDFIRPFAARNTAEFTLAPSGDGTDVTWALYGPSPWLSKVMGVLFDMDAMIGRDFETGLSRLQARAAVPA